MFLITGATGFIGRRLIAHLCAEGVRVRALALPGEDVSGLDKAEIVYGDITERRSLDPALRGVSWVLHLAALVGDWGDDALYHRVNVLGTKNLLDAAAAAGCDRVVVVSSIAVYGRQLREHVCDESSPRDFGVGPYSRSKRAAEQVALDYHDLGRVNVTVVRPGNVYGPGSRIWVDTLVSLLRTGHMVLIEGGSGDAALAYVDNVVDVIVRAARVPHAAGRIYNASDGGGVTWRRYLEDLAALAGTPPPRRSISLGGARVLALAGESTWRLLRRQTRPLFTNEAVVLLSSRWPIPIHRAMHDLGYHPISYRDALRQVAGYLRGGIL